MGRLSLLCGIFLSFLLCIPTAVSAVMITGNVRAAGLEDASGIRVLFRQTSPGSAVDSVFTSAAGDFSIDMPVGGYTISFSRPGYFSRYLHQFTIAGPMTVPAILLVPWSTCLRVPADFPTIQSAIEAARAADTVLVSPGRYRENIIFSGKNIVVGSLFITSGDTARISDTIIDGESKGHAVEFSGREKSTAVLSGFTITHGSAAGSYPHNKGGGILCDHSSPTLSHLYVTCNTARYAGGGIACISATPRITDTTVAANTSDLYGGGVYCKGYARLVNLCIIGNIAESGGGVYLDASSPLLVNTLIMGNIALNQADPIGYGGGGIDCENTSNPTLKNCIVTGNSYFGLYTGSGQPSVFSSDFWGNAVGSFSGCNPLLGKNSAVNAHGDSCDAFGNISLDPWFVNLATCDFRLRDYSPCIGAGASEDAPLFDLAGAPRGTPPDMGPYENVRTVPARAPFCTSDRAQRRRALGGRKNVPDTVGFLRGIGSDSRILDYGRIHLESPGRAYSRNGHFVRLDRCGCPFLRLPRPYRG